MPLTRFLRYNLEFAAFVVIVLTLVVGFGATVLLLIRLTTAQIGLTDKVTKLTEQLTNLELVPYEDDTKQEDR